MRQSQTQCQKCLPTFATPADGALKIQVLYNNNIEKLKDGNKLKQLSCVDFLQKLVPIIETEMKGLKLKYRICCLDSGELNNSVG